MNSWNLIRGAIRWCMPVCLAAVLASVAAFGQGGRGSISGTVTDPGGAAVPGAQVTLLDPATGVAQHAVTSSAGLYTFISLNPGAYQITVSHEGFSKVQQDQIKVTVDEVTQANITLRVGAVTETVTVSASEELVEPSNSTVGSLIPAEAIDRVPLIYRNVYDLVQLSAGVIPVNGSPNSSDSMQSVQNISLGRPGVDVSSATINGSIVGSVYFMLDGSPIGIAENNAGAIIPAMNIPEDGVQEVRVETQNTPASYQSGAAGVISLVSKTGTNNFHGDVFGVFRPDVLSANEYFNKQTQLSSGLGNKPPDFHRYQEGGAIGGPIKKDKLFFFADYEDTQQQQFEGVDFFTVPTTAERTGDFSAMSFPIYDPTTDNGVSGRAQFPGNKITNPNPIGLLYLSKFPKCNLPNPTTCDSANTDVVDNFGLPGLDPFKAHRFDARVDWAASDRQRIFTRFSYDKLIFATANVFPPPGWDFNYAQNVTNGRNVLVADDITLNSSTVLQLRYSFTRHYENQGGPPSYSKTDITNLGTVNGVTAGFPASLAAQQAFKQLPFMLFNDFPGPDGIGGTGDFNTFVYASENSDANAAITKVVGKHSISTGFEWMKRYLNVGQPPAAAGFYAFDRSATDQSIGSLVGGSDFASILVGMGMAPGTESSNAGGYPNFTRDIFAAESNPYYAAFVEDTYHVSKSLTVTAGLRWDIFSGRNERFNRMEYFNPGIAASASGVSYTGAEIYATGGNRSPFATNFHDFGPRLGFAWQPMQHLVVRGGAGFYYGPSTHNVASASANTDGFSSSTTWNATCALPDGNSVFNGTSGCPTPTPGNYTAAFSLSNPFPSGVVPTFTTSPSGLANNLGTTLNTVLRSQSTPTIYNFNFGLEYELPHQVIVSLGYVGSRGLFLPFGTVDLNDLDLATIQKNGAALCVDTSNAACQMVNNKWAPIQPATNSLSGAAQVPLWVSLERFPQFGNGGYGDGNGVIVHGYAGGDSEYSSLQAKVQKRLTSHFTTLSTFTWGKLMTDDDYPPLGFVGSHVARPQDWKDLRYEHSVAAQDVKYIFTGQVSYDLPIGKGQRVNLNGVSNAVAGGWTVNGILYLGSGVPVASPTVGLNIPSGSSVSYFNQRPDLICNPAKGFSRGVGQWVNNACFAFPASPFVPGTAPAYLDSVRAMGARNLDLSIYKTFSLGEHRDLRFDISSYNVTNKAQFGMPTVQSMSATFVAGTPGAAPFGSLTNTVNTPRQFQFGARFIF